MLPFSCSNTRFDSIGGCGTIGQCDPETNPEETVYNISPNFDYQIKSQLTAAGMKLLKRPSLVPLTMECRGLIKGLGVVLNSFELSIAPTIIPKLNFLGKVRLR